MKKRSRRPAPLRARTLQHSTEQQSTAVHKVNADFPQALFERTERAIQALGVSRSRFIRDAVEAFLAEREMADLERSIAAYFDANAARDRQIMREFRHVDGDEVVQR